MKKIGLFFATAIMIVLFAFSVSALEPTGQCGDNVYWSFDESTGELVISGKGAMYDYSNSPFQANNIKNIIIENGVTTIGNYAFEQCVDLIKVTIPSSVETIGRQAFFICEKLSFISVDSNNLNYANDTYGVLYDKDYTRLIVCPAKIKEVSYTVPNGVTEIGEYAFQNCSNLQSIELPSTIKIIDWFAFSSTGLKHLEIPNGVEYIHQWFFYNCKYLESVSIPESVKRILPHAFSGSDNLIDVYYSSDINHWLEVEQGNYNDSLAAARVHYSSNYSNHPYIPTVTFPTCTSKGYTTYKCECNYSYICDYVDEKGHSHTSTITIPATHLTEGVETFTCACGDSYTKPIAMIPHSYNKVVTAPTCTERGYTTYTCACGDTYVGDYVGTKAHSYTSAVTRPATHLSEGVRTYTCTTCGDSYPEAIEKTKEHNYVASNVVSPSCEKEGYTVYACQCGDSYNDNYTAATGHKYDGQTCVNCGKTCSCNCHQNGFMGFIWKIILFFQKLFKTNKTCACGIAHY